ncbi:hypothetical protein B0H63DRAFT_519406 [Podospora didyma]|uniref:Uncharacterized protein n=1 Tax=Podospora didyma TaxID=330526 RepID=A0AAE0U435_9PEZI|nr:hypothetical protein B0H63DRAFT_519406 [Podospora didyma]
MKFFASTIIVLAAAVASVSALPAEPAPVSVSPSTITAAAAAAAPTFATTTVDDGERIFQGASLEIIASLAGRGAEDSSALEARRGRLRLGMSCDPGRAQCAEQSGCWSCNGGPYKCQWGPGFECLE